MKKVVSAAAKDDFTLILKFDDGTLREFDAKPYLENGVFKELKDLSYFKNFRIAFGTIQWKNEQDFSPDTLYIESRVVKENDFSSNHEKVL